MKASLVVAKVRRVHSNLNYPKVMAVNERSIFVALYRKMLRDTVEKDGRFCPNCMMMVTISLSYRGLFLLFILLCSTNTIQNLFLTCDMLFQYPDIYTAHTYCRYNFRARDKWLDLLPRVEVLFIFPAMRTAIVSKYWSPLCGEINSNVKTQMRFDLN